MTSKFQSISYCDVVASKRKVPMNFMVRSTFSPEIFVNLQKKQPLNEENKKIIYESVKDRVKSEFYFEGNFEITFLPENILSSGNPLTDSIEAIRVIFAQELTVIQGICNRISILENEVSSLKSDKFQIYLRSLIEMGRQKYWDKHKTQYLSMFSKSSYISHTPRYQLRVIVQIPKPTSWEHFLEIVKDNFGDEISIGMFNILVGGEGSTYHTLSGEVHEKDIKKLAAAVKYIDEDSFKELFKFVFEKSVDKIDTNF